MKLSQNAIAMGMVDEVEDDVHGGFFKKQVNSAKKAFKQELKKSKEKSGHLSHKTHKTDVFLFYK